MNQKRYGELAKQHGYNLELQVLKSNAGYYIGTMEDSGMPVSRESIEYFDTQTEAFSALRNNTFTQVTWNE